MKNNTFDMNKLKVNTENENQKQEQYKKQNI
jgi:hypothetical protein